MEWGGGEKWDFEIANYLHNKGKSVLIITQPGSALSQRAIKAGILVYHVKLNNLSILNPFKIISLVRVLKRESVDSIILNLSRDLKCGGGAAKIAGVKKIIFRRGSDRPVRNYLINRFLYQDIISHILTNSNATKNAILSNGDSLVSSDKIEVIPNGIDTLSFINRSFNPIIKKKDSVFTIAALGRLVPQKNFEFLIMDDGSSDNSSEILDEYAKEDNRVKIFKNSDNLGLTKSLNILLSSSKGEYLARQDSDDISSKDRFEKHLNYLSLNKLDACRYLLQNKLIITLHI